MHHLSSTSLKMYKQIVAVLALVAASQASGIPALALSAAPAIAVAHAEPVDIHPQYSYSYGVHDPNTGDVKGQTETRDGDAVRGQYSLVESDGTRRVVDYAADSINGFNAVVRREPLAVAAPIVAPSPAVVRTIASPVIAAPAPAVVRTIAAPAIAPAPAVVRTIAAPAIAPAPAVIRTIASPGIATLGAHGPSVSVQEVSGRILVGSAPWALNGVNLHLV